MRHLRVDAKEKFLGAHSTALLDQAVVSGLGFLTIIMIGRWAGPAELGLYAIGLSVLLCLLTVQWTLVALPYMVQRRCPLGTAAEHAGSALAQCGLLLILTTSVLALAASGLVVCDARPELVTLTWTLAGAAPSVLLREFCREFAFAHLYTGRALRLDLAVAAIQLIMLGWLGWTGTLSADRAYAAIGLACALPSVLWLYLGRADFAIRIGQLRASIKRSWTLGKWIFAVQITIALQAYFAYWLLALLAGARATGIYAASVSVATLCNPLVLGLGNVLLPKAILAFDNGSLARLQREVTRDLLLRAAPVGVFCLVVAFAGEDLLRLLYGSDHYTGYGGTVFVLTLAVLAEVIAMPAYNALVSMERPREAFWAELLAAAVTVVLAWPLVSAWGVPGAAYAFLAGTVVRATGWWIVFSRLATPHGNKFARMAEPSSTQVGAGRMRAGRANDVSESAYPVPGG